MTWFKVDDGFYDHPKTIGLSLSAMGLWVRAGSWCARHLTDGRVPRSLLDSWGVDPVVAGELHGVGLWIETDDGWQFHDWEEHQPLRKDVLAKRKADRSRKDAGRKSQSVRKESARNRSGLRTDSSGPDPTRPDPILFSSEESSYPPTTTTSVARADAANTQSGGGSIEGDSGREHEGYRWLSEVLGTFPADLGTWRREYALIGSKPPEERARVAVHIRATQWLMEKRSRATPGHILKHWQQFDEGPRNFEPKPIAKALSWQEQREASSSAAAKQKLEKYQAQMSQVIAGCADPVQRRKFEDERDGVVAQLSRAI